MHPHAETLWRGPRWTLAILLAVLGMLGPFSIDTYLPAFSGIASSLNASPVHMQQTLSAYLFGFAFMNLFHGALADSFGRRPVILWGLMAFTLASLGCALAQNVTQLIVFRAMQGLSCGAGVVVSRAIVRDIFPPTQAQKVMSQITIFFGLAPAIAPIMGGWLFVSLGWHSIFWLLTAIGLALWAVNFKMLPESLHASQRQPFSIPHLMRGYWQRPEDTAKVIDELGFFATGDMAIMDEQGFIKLVDRKKDMIIVSGFNVYPNEVEDVAVMYPKVLECAVIGVPDEYAGEAVKLFVVEKDESLTAEELQKFLKEHLTGYKRPKYIEFRAELPKSNVGKILRRELRDK